LTSEKIGLSDDAKAAMYKDFVGKGMTPDQAIETIRKYENRGEPQVPDHGFATSPTPSGAADPSSIVVDSNEIDTISGATPPPVTYDGTVSRENMTRLMDTKLRGKGKKHRAEIEKTLDAYEAAIESEDELEELRLFRSLDAWRQRMES